MFKMRDKILLNGVIRENYNSKELIRLWDQLVNWKQRMATEGKFLVHHLTKFNCKAVFDACTGTGVSSIHLAKNNFHVVSNEIDDEFAKKALINVEDHDAKVNLTQFDWRELSLYLRNNIFDAVLCLGNSITYLFEKEEQIKALKNFYEILRDNGVLIIDERNYQSILDNKNRILSGNFTYSGRYVYCGYDVHGRPIAIDDRKVIFQYENELTKKKAFLTMYPFKRGELFRLLTEAGFKKILVYSDYSEKFDPEADFYQYICIK